MHGCTLSASIAFLLLTAAAQAQPPDESRLDPPARKPSAQEASRRDALYRFGYGVIAEKQDRLLEALSAFEESSELDPEEAAVHKAQVALLVALDRTSDALAACKKALALNPNDFELWSVSARLQRSLGKYDEARQAIRKGLAIEGVKDHPELAQQLYRDLGDLLEANREYPEAAEAYIHAAKILEHPDLILEKGDFNRDTILNRSAEMYERVGHLYRQARKYDRAIEAYRKAQERSPERAGRLNLHLAELCHDQQRDQPALDYLDAYLRLQPLGLEGYDLKCELLRGLKREAEITPWLEKAAQVDRYNTTLRLLLARELGRAGQAKRADEMFRELSESLPSPETYRAWFDFYRQRNETATVLKMFDEAIDRSAERQGAPPSIKGTSQAKAMLGALRVDAELARALVQTAHKSKEGVNLQGETVQLLAMLADQNRQLDEAEAFYRRGLPQATPANETLIYGGLLRVLNRGHKYEEALKVCADGLAKAKTTGKLLFLSDAARAYAGLDRYDDALRSADEAIDATNDDNKMVVRMLRLRLLSMAERRDQAEAECLALLKEARVPGDSLEVRYLLAGIYTTAKQLDKAEEQLHLILKADPNNAPANNDLGYVWADHNKNLPEAEEMIRKAIEQDRRQRKANEGDTLDEDNAAYLDSLGWVLFRRGRLEEARHELERATKLPDSDDPTIWDHLGDVYEALRQPAAARTAWERGLRCYDQLPRRRPDDRMRDLQRKLKAGS